MRGNKAIRLIIAFMLVAFQAGLPVSAYAADPLLYSAIEEQFLDLLEFQNEVIAARQGLKASPLLAPMLRGAPADILEAGPEKPSVPEGSIYLDPTLKDLKQPIELEQGKILVIAGSNIRRFLVTEPSTLLAQPQGADELLVTGKEIGYTYLHVWDDNDRWTLEFMCVPLKPVGPTYADEFRRMEEGARNFKLTYKLSWNSEETGRSLYDVDLKRTSASFYHTIGLSGQTPYGDLDTIATYRRSNGKTELTSKSLSIKDGRLGPFKGFKLSGGDISSGFSNLAVSNSGISGVNFYSPAFKKKLEYDWFWGRDSGGNQGSVVSGQKKSKNSFLSGADVKYSPTDKQKYKFALAHGWGRDREDYLNSYGYDFYGEWAIGKKVGLDYELAFDSESFANLFNARYAGDKLSLSGQFRDINQKFMSITGSGWAQGQVGTLFNLNYLPTEKVSIKSRLDVYKDRLYPSSENDDRMNEDFDWGLNYRPDAKTGISVDYGLKNDLGKVAQTRYQNSRLNLTRKIKLIKDISTNFGYSYQLNQNYSSPSSDYDNNKILMGFRFSLIGDLYYYFRKEINWLYADYYREYSMPNVMENGLDWTSRIGKSPFYGTMRFNYHDEERTQSVLSFLSGQDYIEGYTELAYRPSADKEIYGNCRVRNTWAEAPITNKRMEASFNAGLRYYWDTGVHWDSVCNIEGYVFRDNNFDGLPQRDDAPVEGIKVYLGDKVQITDLFGYFIFKGVRGRSARVGVDMNTMPAGYLITSPQSQDVAIMHHQTSTLYFGMMSRSEIRGIVFDDKNGNGVFDPGEEGVAGAIFSLETGKKTRTDNSGRYAFTNVAPGKHTVAVDLASIPIEFIPQVPLTKEVELYEGVTYVFNIPMKKVDSGE